MTHRLREIRRRAQRALEQHPEPEDDVGSVELLDYTEELEGTLRSIIALVNGVDPEPRTATKDPAAVLQPVQEGQDAALILNYNETMSSRNTPPFAGWLEEHPDGGFLIVHGETRSCALRTYEEVDAFVDEHGPFDPETTTVLRLRHVTDSPEESVGAMLAGKLYPPEQ
jgi:hypothetical protein